MDCSCGILVLSDVYEWHQKGVATLGLMTIDAGDIVDLPINRLTLKYMQKTTSTALCAIPPPIFHLSSFTNILLPATDNAD